MSMSFEVFPTKKKKPNCNEIIKYSVGLFSEFLKKEKILREINITTREIITSREVISDNEINTNPISLVLEENHHTVFSLNEEGEVYVFYHKLTDLDKVFWDDEIQVKKITQSMQEKINENLKIGYSWIVKRTMGQPAIVSLYYGYLAIAIAILTDGIIYSDDGAWDYSILPIEANIFKGEYLNLKQVSDTMVKDNVERWLSKLKA